MNKEPKGITSVDISLINIYDMQMGTRVHNISNPTSFVNIEPHAKEAGRDFIVGANTLTVRYVTYAQPFVYELDIPSDNCSIVIAANTVVLYNAQGELLSRVDPREEVLITGEILLELGLNNHHADYGNDIFILKPSDDGWKLLSLSYHW